MTGLGAQQVINKAYLASMTELGIDTVKGMSRGVVQRRHGPIGGGSSGHTRLAPRRVASNTCWNTRRPTLTESS